MNSSANNSHNDKMKQRPLVISISPKERLRRCISILCGSALATLSSFSYALGLGDMNATSFLGQPLNATIELLSLEKEIDPESLIVRQVTPDEAAKMGVDIFYAPYRINFIVDKRAGPPVVQITTVEPINEPYLSILVELRWPKGVLYREYPILLDLPPVVPLRSASEDPVRPARKPMTSSASQGVSSRVASPVLQLEPLTTEEGKYRVQAGDTLSKIAQRWREGTTQTTAETTQWLYENNSHAFAGNDINRLRSGALLQMPDLASFRIEGSTAIPATMGALPVKGSGEGLISGEETPGVQDRQQKNLNDVAQVRDMRGLLTLGAEDRDDKTRELIDLLVRENEALKARMEKVEGSEYLDTLKQLIVLQRQQISDLRAKLNIPDNDAMKEMDTLLGQIGVTKDSLREADVSLSTPSSALLPDESLSAGAVLAVEPAVAPPVVQKNESKNWLVWVMFGAAMALSALFIGMFAYYRRMVPAKTPEEGSYPAFASREKPERGFYQEDSSLSQEALDFDGDFASVYSEKVDEKSWMGEQANDLTEVDLDSTILEIQSAFDDMVLDEDALSSLDGIDEVALEAFTEHFPLSESEKPQSVTENNLGDKKKKKKKELDISRRPDEEVRLSIAEKMSQYNPDVYRQEMDSLGLLELAEVGELTTEVDEDDLDTTIYRAMMFCEFKKYEKARELITSAMEQVQDYRLNECLEQIEAIEQGSVQTKKVV